MILFTNANAMKAVAHTPCSNVVVKEIPNARTMIFQLMPIQNSLL